MKEYKIIRIHKKPWYLIFLSVEHWWVWLKGEDGSVKKYSCWAGVSKPKGENLIYSLRKKLSDPTEEDGEQSVYSEVGGIIKQ